MTLYNLQFFDITSATTSAAAGFSDNGGYQFNWGVDTITLTPGADSQIISVHDSADQFFDDDPGGSQTLSGTQTLNGTVYADNTTIDAEYIVHLEDSLGNTYTLQFVSAADDAYNIVGFVVQGPLPPFGEPLTVVSTQDMVNDVYAYNTSTPACIAAGARVVTDTGPHRVERLTTRQIVHLANGKTAKVAFVLISELPANAPEHQWPVTIAAGALGPNTPQRAVTLSPQHRLRLPAGTDLIPARALLGMPGVTATQNTEPLTYAHVVLEQHALMQLDGLECESFWPGPLALKALPPKAGERVRHVMGPNPKPACTVQSVGAARRALGLPRLPNRPPARMQKAPPNTVGLSV
ncbi:MAG: hypothetical protein ACJAYH_000299 [Celeribacter sp.]|jgi:hypothetical protein